MDAPIRIMNTMQLTRVVLRTTSLNVSRVSMFFDSASSIAPTAPIAAASVGVARPARMEPSTANTSTRGGARARTTRPIVTSLPPSALCAGIEPGRNRA